MISIKFLLLFGIITYMGQSVNSLQCYVCDESNKDNRNNCDDETLEEKELKALIHDCNSVNQTVPPIFIHDGKRKATGCVELVLPIVKPLQGEKDKDITIRSCFYGDPNEPDEHCRIDPKKYPEIDFLDISDEDCRICTEDLCNNSVTMRPFLFIISISAIITCFFKLR